LVDLFECLKLFVLNPSFPSLTLKKANSCLQAMAVAYATLLDASMDRGTDGSKVLTNQEAAV